MSRELKLIIWDFGIKFLRQFGKENHLCIDIQIIKSPVGSSAVVELEPTTGIASYRNG